MTQPVRKIIKEAHPELVEKPIYTLLVDGTNLLRVSFADPKVNSKGEHIGGVFQFFLQLKIMLKKRAFDYVYVFFDDEDSGVMRYQLYNDYKANREKNYGQHIEEMSDYWKSYLATLNRIQTYCYAKSNAKKNLREKSDETKEKTKSQIQDEFVRANFGRERDIILKYCNELYIRWMFDPITEGDDLIAYYVQHKKPNEYVYIMSSDEDLTQLITDTVCIWNPVQKKAISKQNFREIKGYPNENVVIKKIFLGDDSDNIGKIDGLSEAKLFEMMPEMKERPVTVEEVKVRAQELIDERIANKKKPLKVHENIVNGTTRGNYNGDFYEINNKIINLSTPLVTPDAETELKEMMYAPQDPEDRSFGNLYKYILEDGIDDLREENRFSNFFLEFKGLATREIEKYKREITK